jgi:hypothetical protein
MALISGIEATPILSALQLSVNYTIIIRFYINNSKKKYSFMQGHQQPCRLTDTEQIPVASSTSL